MKRSFVPVTVIRTITTQNTARIIDHLCRPYASLPAPNFLTIDGVRIETAAEPMPQNRRGMEAMVLRSFGSRDRAGTNDQYGISYMV